MVLDPEYTEKDYKEANVYLAEDRVLCLGIYCQKDERFNLEYIPQALAKTDPMENLIDLLIQRRRWINSSYFAFDFIYKSYNFDVR
jgi:chitin synthase